MRKIRQYIPAASLVFAALAVLAAVVHIASACSTAFADFFQRRIASLFRVLFGYITWLFPFSFMEWMILFIPLWLGLLIFFAVRAAKDKKKTIRMLSFLLSLLLLVYALFFLTYGTGYFGTGLEEKLSLEKKDPTAEELYGTAAILVEKIRQEEGKIAFNGDEGSIMPFSYREMNRELIRAYGKMADGYDFLSHMNVGTKRVMLSGWMSYTGMTGIYSFFTGEANVNTSYPDYSTVFTAAHEMAHARGISREDETNFVAFLACIGSDNAYLRYAGYLNMLQYVQNALYDADKDLFISIYRDYPASVRREFAAYDVVYDKYDGTVVGEVSDKLNNAYLQSVGTEGTVSYGLVVDLCVAFYRPIL